MAEDAGVHRRRISNRATTLGLFFLAIALLLGAPPGSKGAPVTVGGPFTLVAPDGSTVTDETYRGKWLLVFFGYTFCPDTCPMTLSHIAMALEQLGPEAGRVQPIFITVDPERDTPAVMGPYTEAFDARIVGLSGSPEQIAAVSREYGAYSEHHDTGDDHYLVDHSTYIYVMDPRGKFVIGLDWDAPGDEIAGVMHGLINGDSQ
jgi:protein SCO1